MVEVFEFGDSVFFIPEGEWNKIYGRVIGVVLDTVNMAARQPTEYCLATPDNGFYWVPASEVCRAD